MFFTDDQVNTIRIYPSTTTVPYRGYESNRRIKFTNDDVKKIKENFKEKIEDIVIRNSYYTQFSYKQRANSYRVRAVSPGHKEAEKTIIMKGRYLHEGCYFFIAYVGLGNEADTFNKVERLDI